MARRTSRRNVKTSALDFSKWNFIIFLTLALMLIVGVTYAMNANIYELRARAQHQNNPCTSPRFPADWNEQKTRCTENQGGEFSFDLDLETCNVIPACTVRGIKMSETSVPAN